MNKKEQYVDVNCEINIKFSMSVNVDYYDLAPEDPNFIQHVEKIEEFMMQDRNAVNFLLDSPRIEYTITPKIQARLIEEMEDKHEVPKMQ